MTQPTRAAQRVNRLHRRSGHLWRGLAYIERNPVRAHLCASDWEWRWSSAGARCGGGDPSGLLDLVAWTRDTDYPAWRRILERSDKEVVVARAALRRRRQVLQPRLDSEQKDYFFTRLRPH